MDGASVFLEALKSAPKRHRSGVRPWMQKALVHDVVGSGGRCVYCGAGISPRSGGKEMWSMDHLVPLVAGGPDNSVGALVPACRACNSAKGSMDWLLFNRAIDPDNIRRQRLDLLSRSQNHLAPDPSVVWTKGAVQKMLADRWQYPRAAFHAAITSAGAFVGIQPGASLGNEMSAVLSTFAKVKRDGCLAWRLPHAEFLNIVWQLIALNAYICRLDLGPEHPDATPQDNPDLSRWAETYANTGEIVLRRPYRTRGDWSPKRRFPRREPSTEPYEKPVRTRRPRPASSSREQIRAKVDEMLKDSRPVSARGLLPGQRERAAQRDDYDRALLDLGFRMLAYGDEPMPMQPNGCIAHRVRPDGRLGKPRKLPAPRRQMTPLERRAARQAASRTTA